jgi:hypothetical protein
LHENIGHISIDIPATGSGFQVNVSLIQNDQAFMEYIGQFRQTEGLIIIQLKLIITIYGNTEFLIHPPSDMCGQQSFP